MPNAPKTEIRGIRLDDELWSALGEAAARAGTDRSALIRQMVTAYLRRDARAQAKTRPTGVP